MTRRLHFPGSSPVTVSQVCSSPDLEFLPRANFKMDLYTFNCPTGQVFPLLMGCDWQRWQKGLSWSSSTFPRPQPWTAPCWGTLAAPPLHLPHPRTSSGFSCPGWGNSEMLLLPSPHHADRSVLGQGRHLQDAPPRAPTVQFVFIGILRYQNIAIKVSDPSDRWR